MRLMARLCIICAFMVHFVNFVIFLLRIQAMRAKMKLTKYRDRGAEYKDLSQAGRRLSGNEGNSAELHFKALNCNGIGNNISNTVCAF